MANLELLNLIIEQIEVSWPTANGKLKKVKLDSDDIFTTEKTPTSATITSGWHSDINRRVIAPGASSKLRFEFDKDADKTQSNYTIKVKFMGEGCAIEIEGTTPPPPPTGGVPCSELKPIDGIVLEFDSALIVGKTINGVQWYRTTVTDLNNPNPADFVGSIGAITDGQVTNFNGFAAKSATNDVDFVVTLSDGTKVRSRFHRSCSDSDMNDITDCGKLQGDGKANDAGPNLWYLRNLTGNGKLLGCP